MSGALALQTAVRAALIGTDALTDWPVLDGPDASASPPYATLGPDLIVEAGGKGGARLRRHRFAVTLWIGARAVAPLKPAMAAVEAAVEGMGDDLGSVRLVEVRFLRAFTRRDAWRHLVRGEIEFEALVEG
ncbi:MAG: DUF3168 domain-containing protein [Pseudomonadota bacterium]